jgi:hypothetical protein
MGTAHVKDIVSMVQFLASDVYRRSWDKGSDEFKLAMRCVCHCLQLWEGKEKVHGRKTLQSFKGLSNSKLLYLQVALCRDTSIDLAGPFNIMHPAQQEVMQYAWFTDV